jgi:hypothetical protein
MLRLGDLAAKRGDLSEATEYWSTARPLFEQSLQKKDVAEIEKKLAAMEETQQYALAQLKTLRVPITSPEILLNSDNSRIKKF